MFSHKVSLLASLLVIAGSVATESAFACPETQAAPAGEAAPAERERPAVIAVGDVHGDFETFRRLLRDVGVIDGDDRWSGGALHLVQTGDLVDRGAGSRAAIDLMMRLEREAKAAGGSVVVLLGNHEMWNLTGDLWYTAPGEIAAFARDERPALRAAKRREILSFLESPSRHLRSDYYQQLARSINAETFDREFPAGYFAHRAAFSPTGRYGKWLLDRPVCHVDERVLFVHAGIGPRWAEVPWKEINKRARRLLREYFRLVDELERLAVWRRELGWSVLLGVVDAEREAGDVHEELRPHFETFERLRESLLLAEDGPLMYRGLALGSERKLETVLRRALAVNQASAIAIGHTQPRALRVSDRFGGRVLLLDSGLNQKVYGGRPGALIIRPGGDLEVWE